MKVTITPGLLQQLRTPAGGFNQRSMELLGVWPLTRGWQERLVGSEVPDRTLRSAIRAAAEGPAHRFRGNTRRRSR